MTNWSLMALLTIFLSLMESMLFLKLHCMTLRSIVLLILSKLIMMEVSHNCNVSTILDRQRVSTTLEKNHILCDNVIQIIFIHLLTQ
jgi:hypothetical protein